MSFEINYDLNNIKLNAHNFGHLVGNFIIALLFGFWWSYAFWSAWEIWDGFKPWNYQAPLKIKYAAFPSANWFRKELLYSDKFSLQDILIWNLSGALLGSLLKYLIWRLV